ncbi:hypothetical protein ASG17_07700 [Brevundimonas sp. Leaf363]|uniref:GcrA family cell cycle regulator n=1 Tax=Brevundimonas sp. Leaf363 TaxID=1736353 RepID=UPI0006FB7295|nr:GcrA family cell cycle regulator [Brevundimonas sp. Leaf363]KQS55926.1 hypothetical protein ASG17_07700 [Brevundimonas sp. Leaf363]
MNINPLCRDWSQNEEAILKNLWLKGQSASEIASVLPGRTRNAVIGRVHRLGMSRKDRPQSTLRAAAPAKPPREPKAPPIVRNMSNGPLKAEKAAPPPVDSPSLIAPANDLAVLLIDRRRSQCSWPVGEPGRPAFQMCCGGPVPEGANKSVETYCLTHAAKAMARQVGTPRQSEKDYARSLRRWAA